MERERKKRMGGSEWLEGKRGGMTTKRKNQKVKWRRQWKETEDEAVGKQKREEARLGISKSCCVKGWCGNKGDGRKFFSERGGYWSWLTQSLNRQTSDRKVKNNRPAINPSYKNNNVHFWLNLLDRGVDLFKLFSWNLWCCWSVLGYTERSSRFC